MANPSAVPQSKPEKGTVTVLYNGREEDFKYHSHEQVNALLQQALNAFDVSTNRHLMSLYEDGNELTDGESLEDARVEAGDELVLRQSVVKGG
jgi:hypothetical protein